MQSRRFETLTQPIQERAYHDPDRLSLVFWDDDGSELRIKAQDFHQKANHYAGLLHDLGIEAGDVVILVLRHSQELLFAFWGALYLGSIASIFPFLTDKLDPGIYRQRVRELVISSQAKALITFPEFAEDLRKLLQGTNCVIITTLDFDQPLQVKGAHHTWPIFNADKIAFLQHSSGTTGLQKGVALSHQAVLNQIEAYSKAIDLQATDVVVSWLPLYHDMGLIAGFVMPLFTGTPLVLMSPFRWVKNPAILFKAITQEQGTLCWLPNFAYNHSARAIRERDLEGYDLSRMRLFINCSEPIYNSSHRMFLDRFAKIGLRPENMSTCYAMAENTFAVTQHLPGVPPRIDWVNTHLLQKNKIAVPETTDKERATAMVSSGITISGTEIRVVGDRGEVLAERLIGEVALKSDCMLTEYYHRPDLTSQAIQDGWYFTGDMGYIADGELYITGRKKDLILVGGKNIYPQDLEAIANSLPGFIPGRNAAFGVFDPNLGSENVIMVCEVENPEAADDKKKDLELLLRKAIVQQSEIALSDVRFVSKRWLIKTSSGKISRASNREKYLHEFIENI